MNNEPLPPKIKPPPSTFLVAFILCLAAFGVAHLAQYLLLSTPAGYRIGIPTWFWTQHGDYTRFRVFSFAIDLSIALFFSYRIARWNWLHRRRQFNASK